MKLAIKGHPTRGNEVIALLEMLGGRNDRMAFGNNAGANYFIDKENKIVYDFTLEENDNYIIFTLEEFEQKFPYKVGDKVHNIIHNENQTITNLSWDIQENEVVYQTDNNEWVYVNYIQPYKEKTMEIITIDDFKANTKEWLIDKLGNMSMKDALQTINNIYNELHKSQYPKAYEECCGVVNANPYIRLTYDLSNGQKFSYDADNIELYNSFRRLKIYRDTYWKIAGEQMGLGKPWKSDWNSGDQERYGIIKVDDNGYQYACSTSFVFPTQEMRDAFYENFKELIEYCKEFL